MGNHYKKTIRAHKREVWESATSRARKRKSWESVTREQLGLIKERCGKARQEENRGEVWESATREQLELIKERCEKALQESKWRGVGKRYKSANRAHKKEA